MYKYTFLHPLHFSGKILSLNKRDLKITPKTLRNEGVFFTVNCQILPKMCAHTVSVWKGVSIHVYECVHQREKPDVTRIIAHKLTGVNFMHLLEYGARIPKYGRDAHKVRKRMEWDKRAT